MNFFPIAIVGAGVMGEAIITALISSGIDPYSIAIVEKKKQRRSEISNRLGVQIGGINKCGAVFLLTKPCDLESSLSQIKSELRKDVLVVSFVAGKKIANIQETLGPSFRILRVMPNTPITVGEGFVFVSAGKLATAEDLAWLVGMLAKISEVVIIPEELQDAATALSGSGPAYLFAMIEAMADAGNKLGLSEVDSMKAAKKVLVGAAAMVVKMGDEPKILRQNVTSPNGTTFAALEVLAKRNFSGVVYEAMKAARDRSAELGE